MIQMVYFSSAVPSLLYGPSLISIQLTSCSPHLVRNRPIDIEHEFTVTKNHKLLGCLRGNFQGYKVMIGISLEEEMAAHCTVRLPGKSHGQRSLAGL